MDLKFLFAVIIYKLALSLILYNLHFYYQVAPMELNGK